jgi:hypothetical protein
VEESAHSIVLRRAAEVAGGNEALRAQLGVSRWALEAWLAGAAPLPTEIFLAALEIGNRRLRSLHLECDSLRTRSRTTLEQAQRAREYFSVSALKPLEETLCSVMRATGADMGNVQLLRPEGLRIVAQRGFQRPFLDFFACVNDRSSACGAALRSRRRVVVADVARDPIFADTPAEPVLAAADVRAVQSTPLLGARSELVGVLSTHYASPRRLTPRDELILDCVARRGALVLGVRLAALGAQELRIARR